MPATDNRTLLVLNIDVSLCARLHAPAKAKYQIKKKVYYFFFSSTNDFSTLFFSLLPFSRFATDLDIRDRVTNHNTAFVFGLNVLEYRNQLDHYFREMHKNFHEVQPRFLFTVKMPTYYNMQMHNHKMKLENNFIGISFKNQTTSLKKSRISTHWRIFNIYKIVIIQDNFNIRRYMLMKFYKTSETPFQ